MRRLVAVPLLIAPFLVAPPALADELVATRPGLMCVSADALGKLTLPGGDSRTHGPGATAADRALAASGGCVDIPPGARVTVLEAFRNTSRVFYAGPGAPPDGRMTIPNIDFGPASAAPAAAEAPGGAARAVSQRVPVSDGRSVVLLLDRRIGAALRDKLWNTGDADGDFMNYPELRPRFARQPPVMAELQLQNPDGAVLASRTLERPLAKLAPLPVRGIADPALLLTVDFGQGAGGFNGPLSEVLMPARRGLSAVDAVEASGRSVPVVMASTMHASWRIAPARGGGPEEILSATCPAGDGTGRLHLESFRFVADRWTVRSRVAGPCGDLEVFPDRREFP